MTALVPSQYLSTSRITLTAGGYYLLLLLYQ